MIAQIMTPLTAERPAYENERAFAVPSWFRTKLERAIRSGRLGPRFERGIGLVATIYRAGAVFGWSFDHLGRKGEYLTSEPYANRVCIKALREFCAALDIEAEILGADQSAWNGKGDGFGIPTVLVVFQEKR